MPDAPDLAAAYIRWSTDTQTDSEATNTTTATHAFTFSVSFFDASGNLLGKGEGAEDGIAAGQTKTDTAESTDNVQGYAKISVQVDAMIQ